MKKWITLYVFIFTYCLSAQTQQPLHITTDATYFDPATLRFYKPLDNGTCLVYGIDTHFDYDSMRFTAKLSDAGAVNLEEYLTMQGKTTGDLVLLYEIKKDKTGYDKKIEQFTYRSLPKTDEDTNRFETFTVINPEYFLLDRVHGTKDEDGIYSYDDETDYMRYALIVVNKRFTLYVDQQRDYHIVNYNGQFDLYIDGEYQKMQATLPSEKFTALIKRTYPVGEKFEENGKTGLRAYHSSTVLVPAQYDSLFPETRNFILAYKNKKPYLFYPNGDPVKLKNLRAVHKGYNISVLTGNTVSWLSLDGLLTDKVEPEIICGTYNVSPDSIHVQNGHFILKKYTIGDNYYINGQDYAFAEYELATTAAFKQVYFINGLTAIDEDSSRYLIVETHDGKKGLITPEPGGYNVALTPHYQNIKRYYNNIIRIDRQDGLSGYWPLNKEPRYTALAAFDKGFAHFTLPGGKQGWLAMDGKEYLDE